MNRLNAGLWIGALSLLVSAPAIAADPIAPEPSPVVPEISSSNVYVQLLGGFAYGGFDKEFFRSGGGTSVDAMESGWALAGTVGVVVQDGFSIEGDVFYTARDYADFDGGLTSLSLMVNAKYTAAISDTATIYGAVGVGYIMGNDTWDDPTDIYDPVDNDYGGFGYQLIAGATMAVTDTMSLVGEVRYQDGFANLEDNYDNSYNTPNAAVLAGVKFGF